MQSCEPCCRADKVSATDSVVGSGTVLVNMRWATEARSKGSISLRSAPLDERKESLMMNGAWRESFDSTAGICLMDPPPTNSCRGNEIEAISARVYWKRRNSEVASAPARALGPRQIKRNQNKCSKMIAQSRHGGVHRASYRDSGRVVALKVPGRLGEEPHASIITQPLSLVKLA